MIPEVDKKKPHYVKPFKMKSLHSRDTGGSVIGMYMAMIAPNNKTNDG